MPCHAMHVRMRLPRMHMHACMRIDVARASCTCEGVYVCMPMHAGVHARAHACTCAHAPMHVCIARICVSDALHVYVLVHVRMCGCMCAGMYALRDYVYLCIACVCAGACAHVYVWVRVLMCMCGCYVCLGGHVRMYVCARVQASYVCMCPCASVVCMYVPVCKRRMYVCARAQASYVCICPCACMCVRIMYVCAGLPMHAYMHVRMQVCACMMGVLARMCMYDGCACTHVHA
jgi:hypothetical protein